MAILQAHFGYKKQWGGFGMFIGFVINRMILDQWSTFYKLTMLNHCQDAMLSHNVNPTTWLWERIGISVILKRRLSKWFEMTMFCIVLVLGDLEDECTISNLAFMKTKFRNQLTKHLDLILHMYVQTFYILETFPFNTIIIDWNDNQLCVMGWWF
jgi:hypothetical protein